MDTDQRATSTLEPQVPTARRPDDQDDAPALRRHVADLENRLQTSTDDLIYWRTTALRWWAELTTRQADTATKDAAALQAVTAELAATRATISWRITAPIRAGRRALARFAAR